MRVLALFALTGLALAAAACATVEPTPPSSVAVAPTPVEGYDWFFHQDAAAARLAYGLEASDDLRLGLDCERASGRLSLSASGPKGAELEIQVESGGETERFAARSESSELHDGVFLTAEADTDAPVFQRFRRLGWLAIWQDGARQAYAPHPRSAPNIEKFFAFCG